MEAFTANQIDAPDNIEIEKLYARYEAKLGTAREDCDTKALLCSFLAARLVSRSRKSPRELAFASFTSLASWNVVVFRLGRSMTKPDEPVLFYLQDWAAAASSGKNFLWCPQTLNYHMMGFSGGDVCSPFFYRLHSRQVSHMLSWGWPLELSKRSTLNCRVCFGW